MPAITFTEIGEDAFGLLNVFLPGEAVPSADMNFARRFCNDMLSEWAQRPLFIPVIRRQAFDLVADQGGPDDPYTIGDGGDWDIPKPANQNSIVSANLILGDTDPAVRVPLGIYTTQAYNANQIPGMSNRQPTGLYYSPTYEGDGLGMVYLWPVPDTDENTIELFVQESLAQFADTSTEYYVPDGVPRLLKYNLADALQVPYGKELGASAQRIAQSSLATFKRSNTTLSDLMTDAYMFTAGRRTLYNIQSGSGG